MRSVGFLSMDDMDGYVSDDYLAVGPLNELGWNVQTVSWRNPSVDWNDFAAVVIRTPWDYQKEPDAFLRVLDSIDHSSARLENPLDIVHWNLNKRYLREMESYGCTIVPTLFDSVYTESEFVRWQQQFGGGELIVKPTVSATAQHTYRLTEYDRSLESVFAEREFLVQPFIRSIESEGEYSLFYFGGEFSHAINKAPKPADFRVQEEHGGMITTIEPDEKLLKAGMDALDHMERELLYARVDLVRNDEGNFALMELELIEPALYFRMDKRSPELFAKHFDRRMNEF